MERFLIVDDAAANVLFFEVLLGELGKSQIFTADNGTTGLQMADQHRAEFVIQAWEMEPMSGAVFIQKLRNISGCRNIPSLIYSKKMREGDLRLIKELGIENCLGMPFDKVKAGELITSMMSAEEGLTKQERKLRKIEELMEEGKLTGALQMFDTSLNIKAYRSRSKTMLAEIYVRIGKPDRAEKVIQEVLQEEDYPPAHQTLANIYSLTGRHKEAIDLLESISKKSPSNLTALLNLGNAYIDADRTSDAKKVLGKISDLDDDNSHAREGLAKIACKEGDWDQAASLLQATTNGDSMARFCNNLAISYVNNQHFEKGIQTYENAIKILGNKAKLHLLKYNLGLAYRKMGDFQKGFKTLSECFLLEPKFDKSYAALVRLVQEMKGQGLSYDLQVVRQVKEAHSRRATGSADQKFQNE